LKPTYIDMVVLAQ